MQHTAALATTETQGHYQPAVLVIADDRMARMLLTRSVIALGHTAHAAATGAEALALLQDKGRILDAVIVDYTLTDYSALSLVGRIKSDPVLAGIPVIMLTAEGEMTQVQRAIDAGVYYSLPKTSPDALLGSVLTSALRERGQRRAMMAELSRRDAAGKQIRTCTLSLKTLLEAHDVACFLATCFPQPDRVVTGLVELLTNAVEHGNLDVGFETKGELLASKRWLAEIDRRLVLPQNASKTVDVIYQHKADGWYVQISDKGAGFNWKKYWHIDPTRAGDGHGRGIARARLTSFDKMSYNDSGNQVTAMVSAESTEPLGW